MGFTAVAEIEYDPRRARIFEHGWQSWSPSRWYSVVDQPSRPTTPNHHVMAHRPGVDPIGGPGRFQGEGLLAIATGHDDEVMVIATVSPDRVPSVRCEVLADRLVITADGEVTVSTGTYAHRDDALAAWATDFAAAEEVGPTQVFGPSWCSWYAYWGKVTERDVMAEVQQIEDHQLNVDLVLLDEGYQAEIGDWLTPRPDFGSTERLAADIRDGGRRAGIWVAPFLVSSNSDLAHRHPDWLVPDVSAGMNWGHDQRVLDVTHPDAAAHLREVFFELCRQGYDHFKLDFIYAGGIEGSRHEPVDGVEAYRYGLSLIRDVVGANRVLQGCGAPILPSLGLVDCMRVSPDTDPTVLHPSGDLSQPGQRGARFTAVARDFLHGRWWANDPDCLIIQPGIEEREAWADHIAAAPGLRMSSDPIGALDPWALERTREILVPSSAEPHQARDPGA